MEDGTGEFLLRPKHDAGWALNVTPWVGMEGVSGRTNQIRSPFSHALFIDLSFRSHLNCRLINCSGFVSFIFERGKTGQGFTSKSLKKEITKSSSFRIIRYIIYPDVGCTL